MPDSLNDEFLDDFEPEPDSHEDEYHKYKSLYEVLPPITGFRPLGFTEKFTKEMFILTLFLKKALGEKVPRKVAVLDPFKSFSIYTFGSTAGWPGNDGSFWVCDLEGLSNSERFYFPYVAYNPNGATTQEPLDVSPVVILTKDHLFASNFIKSVYKINQSSTQEREPSIGNVNFAKPAPLP